MDNTEKNNLKIQREKEIFEFVKSLTFNAMGIEDNLVISSLDDLMNNKPKINFNSGFERYFYNKNNNASENENAKLDAGLSFMKEVVKVHGTDESYINSALVAVTDYFVETQNFTAKLMQNTLKSEEYKEEFDKEQTKEEEKIISLVRNNEI